MKIPTADWLEKRRAAVVADLTLKLEAEDWHGVADAAMDLREIDAQLAIVPRSSACDHLWRYDIQTDGGVCEKCHQRVSMMPV